MQALLRGGLDIMAELPARLVCTGTTEELEDLSSTNKNPKGYFRKPLGWFVLNGGDDET